jgi:hypothetical protein
MFGDELDSGLITKVIDYHPGDEAPPWMHFAFIVQTGYWCIRQFNMGNRFAVDRLMGVVLQLRQGLKESREDLPDTADVLYSHLSSGLENAVALATGVKPQQKEQDMSDKPEQQELPGFPPKPSK